LGKNPNNINKSFSVAMFFCIYKRCFCGVNAAFHKVLTPIDVKSWITCHKKLKMVFWPTWSV
jgi:hypothetical protein